MAVQKCRAHEHKHVPHGPQLAGPRKPSREGKRCFMLYSLKCVLPTAMTAVSNGRMPGPERPQASLMLESKPRCGKHQQLCCAVMAVMAAASFRVCGRGRIGTGVKRHSDDDDDKKSHHWLIAYFPCLSVLEYFNLMSCMSRFPNPTNDPLRNQMLLS